MVYSPPEEKYLQKLVSKRDASPSDKRGGHSDGEPTDAMALDGGRDAGKDLTFRLSRLSGPADQLSSAFVVSGGGRGDERRREGRGGGEGRGRDGRRGGRDGADSARTQRKATYLRYEEASVWTRMINFKMLGRERGTGLERVTRPDLLGVCCGCVGGLDWGGVDTSGWLFAAAYELSPQLTLTD
ncbi:hypothetical protein B0H34DRAFT_800484 [Crassisporium funariophilum]|nr:hypothetical protein B0H34DRAFT_800484 [Crassisporium funariophilum]